MRRGYRYVDVHRIRRPWMRRAMSPLIIVAALAFGIWWPLERPASTISGQARIIDGDTIEIAGERIRFLDIDAPESDQPCRQPDGSVVQCGELASGALSSLVGSQSVACDLFRRDRYGRWLAHCSVADQDIATWLARSGLAVPYRDCRCVAVRVLSAYARLRDIGIWSTAFDMPWDWRSMN